jgi:hypothetical protein
MAMGPAGLGTKNEYAGEDQQQFARTDISSKSDWMIFMIENNELEKTLK